MTGIQRIRAAGVLVCVWLNPSRLFYTRADNQKLLPLFCLGGNLGQVFHPPPVVDDNNHFDDDDEGEDCGVGGDYTADDIKRLQRSVTA